MTDETKKIEIENENANTEPTGAEADVTQALENAGFTEGETYEVPADAGEAGIAAVEGHVAAQDGTTEEMPPVGEGKEGGTNMPPILDDTVAAVNQEPEKAGNKKIVAIIAAAVVVLAIGAGVAFAMRPATSAATSTASTSTPSSATSSSSASTSASASASSASSAASDTAASQSATAASSGTAAASGAATTTDNATANNGNASAGTTQSNNTSNTNASTQQPAHEHNWVPITETRTVVDQEAWDEPVYEKEDHWVCSKCGDVGPVDGWAHMESHGNDNVSGGDIIVTVQTGTIHHDAVTHEETITVGYQCSGCGATK